MYTPYVLAHLQKISGFFFYLLGVTFFASYLFVRNEMFGMWPAWWMQVADLPLAFSALMYGGLSLYLGLTSANKPAKTLGYVLVVVLGACFLLLVAFNFWKGA